jgi:hypothetical protein
VLAVLIDPVDVDTLPVPTFICVLLGRTWALVLLAFQIGRRKKSESVELDSACWYTCVPPEVAPDDVTCRIVGVRVPPAPVNLYRAVMYNWLLAPIEPASTVQVARLASVALLVVACVPLLQRTVPLDAPVAPV